MALRSIPKTLTLASFLTRSLAASSNASVAAVSRSSGPLLNRLRPLAAVAAEFRRISPAGSFRTFATRAFPSSLNDPNPNWSNRPPKETILLDGCDFNHWLVVVEPPEGNQTRDEIIDSYIKILAQIVGSEDEARMKIYSVSTRHYFAFGALVSEEDSYKLKELPRVRWVLPDSYLDVRNKDYGGEPFINGQAVPYDEKYHAEWVRNNARAQDRNRRNDRPRGDRNRTFERRRENMQNRQPMNNAGPPPPNMNVNPANSGAPVNNMNVNPANSGAPVNNMNGDPANTNMPGTPAHTNMGGYAQANMNGPPGGHGNMGYRSQGGGYGNMPPNQGNYGSAPPNQSGYANVPPNQGAVPPNQGGVPPYQGGYANVPPNQGGYANVPPNQGGHGYTNMPPNQGGYSNLPRPYQGGYPGQNAGWAQSNQNMGGFPPNNQSMSGTQQPNAGWSQGFTPSRDGSEGSN